MEIRSVGDGTARAGSSPLRVVPHATRRWARPWPHSSDLGPRAVNTRLWGSCRPLHPRHLHHVQSAHPSYREPRIGVLARRRRLLQYRKDRRNMLRPWHGGRRVRERRHLREERRGKPICLETCVTQADCPTNTKCDGIDRSATKDRRGRFRNLLPELRRGPASAPAGAPSRKATNRCAREARE